MRKSVLAVAVLLVCSVVWPGCPSPRSSLCPEDMLFDQAGSVPDKSIWCRSKDKKAALYVELHKDGKARRQVCTFRDGKPEGSFTAWHPEGRTWIAGQYREGQLTGRWTQWDKAGAKVAEGDYRDGRFIAGAPVAGSAVCGKLNP